MSASMFRSMGEFTTYAREVFDLFADTASATPTGAQDGHATPQQHEKTMDRIAVREAFAVLFGYHPSATLLRMLSGEDADGSVSGWNDGVRITEEVFLRFVQSCASHEDGLVAEVQAPTLSSSPSGSASITKEVSVQLLFQALARGKSHADFSDFLAADGGSSVGGVNMERRNRVLRHVFDVLDTDRNGQLQFSDVKEALLVWDG